MNFLNLKDYISNVRGTPHFALNFKESQVKLDSEFLESVTEYLSETYNIKFNSTHNGMYKCLADISDFTFWIGVTSTAGFMYKAKTKYKNEINQILQELDLDWVIE